MQGKVSTLDVMPVANDVFYILADLYALENEIKGKMTYHDINYVIIRLVTIFERLLKILAISSTDISSNSKVEVDVTTLRTILEGRAEPTNIIKRIMAEIGSYQNINTVKVYFQNHKPTNGKKFILTNKEKNNLDKLFKLRHRLTHTVDRIAIETDGLQIFYKTVLGLVMRLIREYTPLSEPFVKGNAYQNLNMYDTAKKYFEETIRLHGSKSFDNMHDTGEYCLACVQVDKLEQALCQLYAIAKAIDRPDSNISNNELAVLYALMGTILTDLNRYEDAEKSLIRGLEIAPDHSPLLFEMTNVQLKLGNAEQALECALRTLTTSSDPLYSYYWLAKVYSALGNDRVAKMLSKHYECESSKRVKKQSSMSQYRPDP